VLCGAVALLVGALGIPAAAADDSVGLLRIAHLSPDTPAVDVALAPLAAGEDGPLTDPGPDVATGVHYGDLGAFTEVPPGAYAVSVRSAGTGRATAPVLTARIDVPAGEARTVALSGLFADLALETLSDDLSAPPTGSARVRVLSAAAAVESVDVGLDGGPVLATSLPFGGTGSAAVVPAGPGTVRVDGAPGEPAALPVTWAPGTISTLVVLDAPGGGLTVRVVLDAAGPGVVPTGAVEAGGGGPAGLPTSLPWALGAAAALAAVSRRGRVLAVVAAAVVTAAPWAELPVAHPVPQESAVTLAAASTPRAAAPVRLQVPSVGMDTTLTGIDLDAAGALVPPPSDALAGWYRQGPAPGDPGPAVLTGHVDSADGPAVFFHLRDVAVGDAILVDRADGTTVRFTVTRVARYPKGAFPAAEVYGPTPDAELRLITCGGVFDRAARSYTDNLVLYATHS
jgi:hypothetical protein